MKLLPAFFSVITLVFIGSGCSGETAAPDTHQSQPKQENRVDKKVPSWFLNPNLEGYIGAVGSAPRQKNGSTEMQKRIALIQAKANIAKQIEVYIENELKTQKECSSEQCKSSINTSSTHQSGQMIRNVIQKEEWTDPETGTLYIWVVTRI